MRRDRPSGAVTFLVPPTPSRDLASRGGLGTWWWDIASDAVTWDDGMRRLFAVPEGTRVASYGSSLDWVHEEDRPAVAALVTRALAEGADYDATFRVRLPDGGERVIAARGVVYCDADGKPARMIGVCWDGTAQRRAEEELRQSEARYRGLVESQQDLVFRFDLEERVTFANDAYCAKFGLRREDLLGRGLTHLHPDDRAATTAAIVGLLQPPHQGMLENRVMTPEGWRRISWSGCAIADEHGTIVEIQCVGRDVTERRIAEENLQASNDELQQSQERLRSLARRLAAVREDERRRLGLDLHDGVCQDLAGIALLVGSLRQQAGVGPDTGTQLDRIERYLHGVGDHLRRLAHELRPMLLHDLGLEGSIGSLVQAFSTDVMRVTARFESAIPRLAEHVEIGVFRVVQEAVTNACRHGAPSAVLVTLDVGASVRLAVRDDGVGFDPAGGRAHAFGLVSMEERALALNGSLAIESTPGRGTVLRFECPALPATV
jgi:PAS domain S-box-containing protein